MKRVVAGLVGFVIFSVLPLVAWGAGSLAGFVAEPARLAYVITATALTVVISMLVASPSQSRGRADKLVARQQLTIVLMQLLGIATILVAPWSDRHDLVALPNVNALRVAGVVVYGLGMILTSWAQVALGPQFSTAVTIQDGHELVSRGPFRVVRHPRYLGVILFHVGYALVFRSTLALVLSGGVALTLLWRIHDEDDLLRRELGAAWDSYARRTARLIPFVY